MKSEATAMKQLCKKMSRDIGDGLTAERLFAQKMAFAAAIRSKPPKERPRRIILAFAAASVVFVSLLFFLKPTSVNEQIFAVGKSGANGEIGIWEATTSKNDSVFNFAKGSRIDLSTQTTARIAVANETLVKVELKAGTIDADIVGNGETRWMVSAGPYHITVLGTRFTAAWHGDEEILDVRVLRGKVLVQGPEEGDHGVVVKGGNYFHASQHKRSVFQVANSPARKTDIVKMKTKTSRDGDETKLSTAEPISKSAELLGGEADIISRKKVINADIGQGNTVTSFPEPQNHSNFTSPNNGRLKWLVHYANGNFREALGAALNYGIHDLAEELDAVMLWKLQDAARVTRKYDVSAQILRRYRERFPMNRNSKVANFLLGRIAMDKKKFSSAAQWFNTYIVEDPKGPLEEEAYGLLIVVYEKIGSDTMAQKAAINYLERYDGGAFSKIARAHLNAR